MQSTAPAAPLASSSAASRPHCDHRHLSPLEPEPAAATRRGTPSPFVGGTTEYDRLRAEYDALAARAAAMERALRVAEGCIDGAMCLPVNGLAPATAAAEVRAALRPAILAISAVADPRSPALSAATLRAAELLAGKAVRGHQGTPEAPLLDRLLGMQERDMFGDVVSVVDQVTDLSDVRREAAALGILAAPRVLAACPECGGDVVKDSVKAGSVYRDVRRCCDCGHILGHVLPAAEGAGEGGDS